MLPFFAKLSEKFVEKVFSLLTGPGQSDKKRKRNNEMEVFNTRRGPEAKKMKMYKGDEERYGGEQGRKGSCVNNNNVDNSGEGVSSLGREAKHPFGKQEEVTAGNESPLKALLSIKKEHAGSSMRRPRARNPYSIHHLGSTRVIHWTEDQLEILRSALASFRYSPRSTRDRVYIELRVSQRGFNLFTKEDVGNWLSKRCDYDCSQRLLLRKRKIEEIGDIEVCQKEKTRKIRFSEETEQKYFSTLDVTSAVAENHVVYVPLKE